MMSLILTPPYLILLGVVIFTLGDGEDSLLCAAAGAAVLLVGLIALGWGALHRRWVRRLRMDSLPVRAEIVRTVTAPFTIGSATPRRLLCRGQTAPFLGRSFRSGWLVGNGVPATGVVTVLIDPRRTSRYLVDVAVDGRAATFIERVLRHLGTLAIVLGVGIVELVALDAGQPAAPLAPVHGEVLVDGSRFGKGGLHWQPNLCRAATNPGVTAVALIRRGEAYPLAQILADPSSNIAAVDVQRAPGEETVRFLPSTCTRLHGRVTRDPSDRAAKLRGYADAECRDAGAELTLHMDFAGCA